MEKISILVICAHSDIRATIVRLLNTVPEWTGSGVADCHQALARCDSGTIDLVLIGAGIADREEMEFQNLLHKGHPRIPVIKHYGGGSGLLFAEVWEALRKY